MSTSEAEVGETTQIVVNQKKVCTDVTVHTNTIFPHIVMLVSVVCSAG